MHDFTIHAVLLWLFLDDGSAVRPDFGDGKGEVEVLVTHVLEAGKTPTALQLVNKMAWLRVRLGQYS